jgi:hypothetical protein
MAGPELLKERSNNKLICVQAAVLLAERRYKEAAEKAVAALAVLPKSADPGGAVAEKEWSESILAESQRQIG